MRHIMLAESGERIFKQRISGPLRHGPFHQLPDTIAHKTSDVVNAVRWHPMSAKGVIDGCRKVA